MKTTLKKRMTKNVVNPEKENGHKHCSRGEGGLIIFYFFLLFLQICHNILLKDMPWNNETNTKTGIENSVNTWSQQPKSWISKPRPWVSLKCPPGCFAFWDTGNAAMLVFSLDPRTSCIFFKINFCICACLKIFVLLNTKEQKNVIEWLTHSHSSVHFTKYVRILEAELYWLHPPFILICFTNIEGIVSYCQMSVFGILMPVRQVREGWGSVSSITDLYKLWSKDLFGQYL